MRSRLAKRDLGEHARGPDHRDRPTRRRAGNADETLGASAHQNPLVTAVQRVGPVPVLKFSNVTTHQELHKLEVPARGRYALNRARRDFSKRDDGMLDATRPLLERATRSATA
jgi:hypothetical protein